MALPGAVAGAPASRAVTRAAGHLASSCIAALLDAGPSALGPDGETRLARSIEQLMETVLAVGKWPRVPSQECAMPTARAPWVWEGDSCVALPM